MHSCATPGADHLRQAVDVDRVDVQARVSMASRIVGVHGSAPKMPISSDDRCADRCPVVSISSAIASMYDGVTMMIGGLEVVDQLHLPLGLPPDIGITVQPSFSAP